MTTNYKEQLQNLTPAERIQALKEVSFMLYMRDTFETKFDPDCVDHLVKQAIFYAGWDALAKSSVQLGELNA